MAAQIVITTDAGVLDLFVGAETEFYITRQIHDLHDFETRNASFSKALEIPPTETNLRVLNVVQDSPTTQGVICSVVMAGVTVANNAFLYYLGSEITNDRKILRIQILSGNFNFFNAIAEADISLINWADLQIEWETAEVITANTNTVDLVVPVADWLARGNSEQFDSVGNQDINQIGFFIYAKEIIRRIISEADFTMVEGANLPADFSTIALACPMDKFVNLSDVSQVSVFGFVSNNTPQTVSNVLERAIFPATGNAPVIWQPATNEYEIELAATYDISLDGIFTHTVNGIMQDSEIRIMLNGGVLATFFANGDVTDIDFFISTQISGVPGDLIFIEIESFTDQTTLTLEPLSFFGISTPGADISRTVQPDEFVPPIAQKTFLTGILNIFNLVLITDDIAKTVTIRNFNDIFSATEQDLTTRLDVGGTIDVVPGIDSLGRDSNFKWGNDNLLRTDADFTVRFLNDVLETSKDVITLPFSACDNSLNWFNPLVNTFLKALIPMVSYDRVFQENPLPTITIDGGTGDFTSDVPIEYNVGSIFDFSDVPPNQIRVTKKSSDVQGTLTITGRTTGQLRSIMTFAVETFQDRLAIMSPNVVGHQFYQGDANTRTTLDPTGFEAIWFDRLIWENLIEDHYKELLNALQTPQVVKGLFNLTVFDFIQLDHLRPVYIDQLNAFFYINKIEQFKIKNKTRLELIRISSTQIT